MGRGVSDSHQELAGQLGKTQCLFPVFQAHTAHHLHDQHRGGLSPTATQGDQEQGGFPNDTALEELVFLAFTRIRRKWTQPVQNWGQTAQQLAILFPDRFRILTRKSSGGLEKSLVLRGVSSVPSQNQP